MEGKMSKEKKKLFAEARETSIGTVITVNELPAIEGEEGIVIAGISDCGRVSICFRKEAAIILTDILNEWKQQAD
jgi:hypothetical protein